MRLQQVLLFLGLLFLAWSCKCANEKGRIEENLVLQSVPATTSQTHPIKDTIVSLSFLSFTLGEALDLNDTDLKISYETTVTEDVLRIFEADKRITFDGVTVPIKMRYYTVNGIISEIDGVLETDRVSKSLIYTYGAKYGEPTWGSIEDPRTIGNWMDWDYKNQSVHIRRDCSQEWNLDARPMRKEWVFKKVRITYEDYALNHKADSIRALQRQYDIEMKPIRDSIEAVRKKAVEDSLRAIERNKLLKDAHQI